MSGCWASSPRSSPDTDLDSSRTPTRPVDGTAMTPPKLILILSENWTMTSPRDLRSLVTVRGAGRGRRVRRRDGQRARGARARRRSRRSPRRTRATTPCPATRIPRRRGPARSCCCPRSRPRPPGCGWWRAPSSRPCATRCLLAKDLATLDLLSEGRLVVQPTVSWHRSEYDALGVPFGSRGALLDEHLAAWDVLWRDTPASFEGTHYRFHDVFLEPKPFRPEGPTLWFGGSSLHDRLIRRIVEVRTRLQPARASDPGGHLATAARDGRGGQEHRRARDGGRDARRVPRCVERGRPGTGVVLDPGTGRAGFTSICIKPSQFIDDAERMGPFCREVVERVSALVG